jgi:hypothetical protein
MGLHPFLGSICSFQCAIEAVEQQFETHDVLGYVRLTKRGVLGCDLLSIVSFVRLLFGSHYRFVEEIPIQSSLVLAKEGVIDDHLLNAKLR